MTLCERHGGAHGKYLEPSEHDIVSEWGIGCEQAHRRKPLQQRLENDSGLEAGQRCAQAVVDTTAKTEDAGPMPFDVESIRMVEHLRIAIGRTEQQHNTLPLANGSATDLHILRGRTAHHLDWCVITQQLVDGASDETGVRAQDVQLLGIT